MFLSTVYLKNSDLSNTSPAKRYRGIMNLNYLSRYGTWLRSNYQYNNT
jgi:hypothetical protein